MAERFNLTAQLQLQAPRNTAQVVNQIRKDLGNLGVNVKIQGDARSLAAISGQLKSVDKTAQRAAGGMNLLNRNIAEAARRFSVITVATGSFIALARSIKSSVGAAIEFEREMIKISQVTGSSVQQLSGLSSEVTKLSTTLGVANQTLLETARILSQAGFSALKTKQALQVLANTTLAPSFDNIIDTTEGAIAIINQFGREASKVGKDIQFLEQALDAINSVSKSFAVESKDLITAVRRTGGVFEAAGGKINELIALFTSVRQTTRESAETIATGFRTIFTRLQRSETLDALKELGIQLSDTEGKFIGPLKAVEALSVGLAGLDPKDVRFNEIVEQLGGFRQIGKVIPLIKQYAVAENALSVANKSAGSTAEDAQTAQKSLAVQFQKVGQQFDALIRKFADSETFRGLATTIIKLAEAFLKFAESLEVVLPQLTLLAGIKLGRALAPGLVGLFGGKRKQFGGVVHGFAGGGFVPGKGNKDTVPAMLTPGEFVIKKRSAAKLGADQLGSMNRYAGGGIADFKEGKAYVAFQKQTFFKKSGTRFANSPKGNRSATKFNEDDSFKYDLDPENVNLNKFGKKKLEGIPAWERYKKAAASLQDQKRGLEFEQVLKGLKKVKLTGGNSRLDGMVGQQVTEIKSLREELDMTNLGNKMIGSAVNPLSSVDKKVQPRLTAKALTDGPNTVDLGTLKVLQDITKVTLDKEKAEELAAGKGKGAGNLSGTTLALGRKPKKNWLGGIVQRFALGGIAQAKKVGAAILDPDAAQKDDTVSVTVDELNKRFPKFRDLKKGASPISSLYKATNFAIKREGLSKATSTKFQNALNDGLVTGTDVATAALAQDLGTSSSKIAMGSKQNFIKTVRPAIRGDLFEAALLSMNNAGTFDSALDPGRPFDFPGGLQGGLKDNFPTLPSEYVDAKSSYAAASPSNMKGKIVNQLVQELKAAGVESMATGTKSAKAAKAAKAASAPTANAKGGSISGTDSVPSLLTPGEFVVNKSSAQAIGYSKLHKMNQTGVAGFAEGGLVGFQRFAEGGVADLPAGMTTGMTRKNLVVLDAAAKANAAAFTALTSRLKEFDLTDKEAQAALTHFARNMTETADEAAVLEGSIAAAHSQMVSAGEGAKSVAKKGIQGTSEKRETPAMMSGDEMAELANKADAVAKEFEEMGVKTRAGQKAMLAYKQAILGGSTAAEAQAAAMKAGKDHTAKLDKEMEKLLEAHTDGVISEKELTTATDKLTKQRLAVKLGGPSGPGGLPGGGGGGGGEQLRLKGLQQKFEKLGGGLGKVQSGLSRLSTGLIGLSFIAGTLIQSSTSLTDAQKEQEQAGINAVSAYGAVAAEVLSFGVSIAAQMSLMAAHMMAKRGEIAADKASTLAKVATTGADLAESMASGTTTGADIVEAVASGVTTGADIVEAMASGVTTGADLGEATASVLATGADTVESAASVIAGGADLAESTASGTATGTDIIEAKASVIAGGADLIEAIASTTAAAETTALGIASSGATTMVTALGAVTGFLTKGLLGVAVELGLLRISTDLATGGNIIDVSVQKALTGAKATDLIVSKAVTGAKATELIVSKGLTTTKVAEDTVTKSLVGSQIAASHSARIAAAANLAESEASGLTMTTDLGEATASGTTASADLVESLASGATTTADLGEATASGLTTGADVVEAGGSLLAMLADLKQAIASGAAAAAAWALTVALVSALAPLILLGIAVAAVAAALGGGFFISMYKTAKAVKAMEQSIEKFNAVADKELEKLKDTGGGSEETFVKSREGAAVTEFNKEVLKAGAGMRNAKVGAMAGSFALAGAALTAWLGPGAILGAAIGAVAGALVGLALSSSMAESEMDKAVKAELSNAAKVAHISNLYATTTWRSVQAIKDFDKALKIAKDANLSASDTLGIMVKGQQNLVSEYEASANRLKAATSDQAELQAKLEKQGLVTAGGTATGTEDDWWGSVDEAKKDLAHLKELNKQREEAEKAHIDELDKLFDNEAKIRSQIAQAIGELVSKLSKGGKDLATGKDLPELSSIKSVEALLAVDKEFEKHYNNAIAAIKTKLQTELDTNLKGETNKGVADALRAQHAARLIEAEQGILVNASKRLLAEQKAARAAIRTEVVERAKQRAINDVNTTLKGFNNILLGATETAKGFAEIDSAIATANFQAAETATFDTSPLEQPFAQIDKKILDKALEQGVKSITMGTTAGAGASPADKEIQDRANRISESVKAVHTAISVIPDMVLGLEPKGGLDSKAATNQIADLFSKINKEVGEKLGKVETDKEGVKSISTAGFELSGLGDVIAGLLPDLFEDGAPDTEGIGELIAALEGYGTGQAAVLIKGIELQNQYLTKMAAANNAIIDQQGKYAEALGRVESVTERAADRLAKAQGQPRDRFAKELGRKRVAQARLGEDAVGAGAIAGDVLATAKALTKLDEAANLAAKAAKATADLDDKRTFNDANARAAAGAKNAARELERLADQSAKAADIEGELNKVRAAKKQVGAIVEGFAFGSDEERFDMGEAFNQLNIATGQGGIQGFDENQRKQVGGLLDQLSDVKIGGGDKTGRELKAQFAEKEAIAQGMDPAIAKQIREAVLAGSLEEQLLNEMKRLGEEEKTAAGLLAKRAQDQLTALEAIRDKLPATLAKESAEAQAAAAAADKSPDEAKKIAELNVKAEAAQDAVMEVAAELLLLETALAKTTKAILESTNQLTDAKTEKTKGEDPLEKKLAAELAQLESEAANDKARELKEREEVITVANEQSFDAGQGTKEWRAAIDRDRNNKNRARRNSMVPSGAPGYSKGGGIFQQRGTDTVPAMLTPGEFVIRKSAVDKIGASNLSVLNRGQAPGFRRGGLIGRGVQYKGRGGSVGRGGMSLMLDTTNIQGVLDNFHAEFAASLDNVVGHFSGMTSAMNNLAGAIKQGMALTHHFTGDLALAFKIENADVLKKTIADAITPTLAEIISREIDQKLNKDFKPG